MRGVGVKGCVFADKAYQPQSSRENLVIAERGMLAE